jgi:hypothetical protein
MERIIYYFCDKDLKNDEFMKKENSYDEISLTKSFSDKEIQTDFKINKTKKIKINSKNDSKYFLNILPEKRKESLYCYFLKYNFKILAKGILLCELDDITFQKIFECFYEYYVDKKINKNKLFIYSKKIYNLIFNLYIYDDIYSEMKNYENFINKNFNKNIFRRIFDIC